MSRTALNQLHFSILKRGIGELHQKGFMLRSIDRLKQKYLDTLNERGHSRVEITKSYLGW